MVDIDLSKTVKITVVPSESLGLTYEKSCRDCALRLPRKDKTYKGKDAMKAMTYCLQECDSKIKHGHESGQPFEIEVISSDYCLPDETKTQLKSGSNTEKIPKASEDMFLLRY